MPTRLLQRKVRTITGASLTTSFQAVGAVVPIAAFKISFVNATTTDVNISDQTANDAFYIPAGSTLSIGEGLPATGEDKQAIIPAQTTYNAKLVSGAAGTGNLVITIEGY